MLYFLGFLCFAPSARCLPPRKFIHGPTVSRRHVMTTTLLSFQEQGLFLKAHSKCCCYSIKKTKITIKNIMALLKHLRWCRTASFTFTLLVSGVLNRPSEVHGRWGGIYTLVVMGTFFQFLVANSVSSQKHHVTISHAHDLIFYTPFYKVLAAKSLITIGHGRQKTKTDNRR